jgi:hypothetical protein
MQFVEKKRFFCRGLSIVRCDKSVAVAHTFGSGETDRCHSNFFAKSLARVYVSSNEQSDVSNKDLGMSVTPKVAFIVFAFVMIGASESASARSASYPLTRCGPDLSYLCPIRGYFDAPPFRYNLAIYPGCIRNVAVETPQGVERRRAVVCGAPTRSMVWW